MIRYWERINTAVNGLSLRERAIIFVAAAFLVIALLDVALLRPLLSRQNLLSSQVIQQQEKMKELQAQMQDLLQARNVDEHSPLRNRLAQLKHQMHEQNVYLRNRQDRLVEPDKMTGLLKRVLHKNGRLQLVELKTLPASLLIENIPETNGADRTAGNTDNIQNKVFKHGVQITVRGSYLDLLDYVTALEKMPAHMLWGEAGLSVDQYPNSVLTLTVYTLSLDKIWLTV